MPTYKDVEPIIEVLKDEIKELGTCGIVAASEIKMLQKAIEIINVAPTADVAPVVHDDKTEITCLDCAHFRVCDRFHRHYYATEKISRNWCKGFLSAQNCGAKMDGNNKEAKSKNETTIHL